MTKRNKPLAALAAATLSLLILTACGAPSGKPDSGVQTPALQDSGAPQDFVPAETGVTPRASFSFPYLGLTVLLPEELQTLMSEKELFMSAQQAVSADGSAVEYALLTWDALDDQQRTEVIPYDETAYNSWLETLAPVGALGVYDDARAAELDSLTGLSLHRHLGDLGSFHFYLSTNPEAAAAPQVDALEVRLYEASPLSPGDDAFTLRKEAIRNVGAFTMEDLDGKAYTESIFAENQLTLVNLFATWCSPCVREIPELEELSHAMEAQGVGVVGIVLDGREAPDMAQKLRDKTGATYPFLLPDDTMMNGRLLGVESIPETFFVDSQGNLVGEVYLGARSLKDWTQVVETELSRLKEAQ